MKQGKSYFTVILWILLAAIAAYFGYHVVSSLYAPLMTATVTPYEAGAGYYASGFVVREEELLYSQYGTTVLNCAEGAHVAANDTVATGYRSEDAKTRQTRIDELSGQIEQLQYAWSAVSSVYDQAALDADIAGDIVQLSRYLALRDMNSVSDLSPELKGLILRRTGSGSDSDSLQSRISALQAELETLETQSAGDTSAILAGKAGTFSAAVDGYEAVLTPDILAELTPSKLSAVRADSSVQSDMGKLILGDTWYYAATMSKSDAETLQKKQAQGIGLTLQFSKSIERSLSVRLESVSEEENGRVVAVFKGRTYLAELTLPRQQGAKIIYKSESGIRIPKEALRAEKVTVNAEGERTTEQTMGAYCVVGMEARFKPVEVLYNGENFVLVRSTAGEDQEKLRLRHGDEVIITANDLYDRKVLG